MKPRVYKKTQVEYAADYGVKPRAIRVYMGKNYPLDDPAAMEGIFAAQKHRPASKAPGESVDAVTLTNEELENPSNEATAKLYERILICRKLAHALREAKRQVIPLDEVRAGEMRVCAAVKSRLLALPGEMPTLLAGKTEVEMQKALFGWVHETLTSFSDARASLYA